jgi:hypothetical protein
MTGWVRVDVCLDLTPRSKCYKALVVSREVKQASSEEGNVKDVSVQKPPGGGEGTVILITLKDSARKCKNKTLFWRYSMLLMIEPFCACSPIA